MKSLHEKVSEAFIEEALCLAVLIATKELPPNAGLGDAEKYWKKIEHCNWCPNHKKCLACIINE